MPDHANGDLVEFLVILSIEDPPGELVDDFLTVLVDGCEYVEVGVDVEQGVTVYAGVHLFPD